jgi:hypothetical protein
MLGPFVGPIVCNFLSAVRMVLAPKSILQFATSLVARREVLCLSRYGSLSDSLIACLEGAPSPPHWLRILFPFPVGLFVYTFSGDLVRLLCRSLVTSSVDIFLGSSLCFRSIHIGCVAGYRVAPFAWTLAPPFYREMSWVLC